MFLESVLLASSYFPLQDASKSRAFVQHPALTTPASTIVNAKMASIDYKNLPTPPVAVADFCLIPIGTPTASVSNEVAAVQRLMKESGLDYHMHSAGTTVGRDHLKHRQSIVAAH